MKKDRPEAVLIPVLHPGDAEVGDQTHYQRHDQ